MTTPAATASPVVATIGQAITDAMVGDLADVVVLDSIDPMQAYSARSVTVGGTWDPELEAFATEQTITVTTEELGGGRRTRETTSVECIAYVGSGDRDFAGHRDAVGQILTAIRTAVRAITEVGGKPARVQLASQQWAQGADDRGTLVMALFTIVAVVLP